MSSRLLDVDLLVACGWQSHGRHREANRWLSAQAEFFTCAPSQMGFLRVSMSPAYRVSFEEARAALADIFALPAHRFLADATEASALPWLSSRHEISDAHLATLARKHQLQLATLDEALCRAASGRWNRHQSARRA